MTRREAAGKADRWSYRSVERERRLGIFGRKTASVQIAVARLVDGTTHVTTWSRVVAQRFHALSNMCLHLRLFVLFWDGHLWIPVGCEDHVGTRRGASAPNPATRC